MMSVNICIVLLLMFPNWIVAEDITKKGPPIAKQIFTIIGLMSGSVFATFGLICVVYLTLKFIKRKMSEPQYCIDDTSSNKDCNEHYSGNDDIYSQSVLNINQIQPNLSISQMISSIKQSLNDLHTALIPFGWSRAQHIYDQKSPVNEKKELSV